MKMKGAMNTNKIFTAMISILLVTILAFTWFFPTLNSSTALNNSTDLEIAGTNYGTWFVPVLVIIILFMFIIKYKDTIGL